MPRIYLIQARKHKGLSQQTLADRVGVERKAISRWETGALDLKEWQQKAIRAVLENNDPHLFDNIPEPCHVPVVSDTVDSSDSHPVSISESVGGFKEFMELLRRQFMANLAKFGGIASLGNVSLAFVSSPVVEPEEYLSQCSAAIDDCWEWLSQMQYSRVERALNAHTPTLIRFAKTISSYQGMAAKLAMQAKIMQAFLCSRKLDYTTREILCAEAVHFAVLSGNMRMYTIALEWQGYTYTNSVSALLQPQRAISIFQQALLGVGSDAPLSKANISIGLALAHAQDKDETSAKENETKALKYAVMARQAMPTCPELDPLHRCIELRESELDQLEGKMYLHLAERSPNNSYAQMAYDAFEKSINKQAMSQGYRAGAIIKKADAARALGELRHFLDALAGGFSIAQDVDSTRGMGEAHDVMGRIPPNWQKETAVQNLQKDISQALILARR